MSGSSESKKLKSDNGNDLALVNFQEAPEEEGSDKNDSSADGDKPTTSSVTSSAAVINPLENVVILEHLFKLCDVQLLANCRLVSKDWYRESLLPWRASSSITFTQGDGDDTAGLYLFSLEDATQTYRRTPLQEFLAYCDDPKNKCRQKPYRFVKLDDCDFSLNPEQFGRIWNAVGINLTTLHLSDCTFKEAEEFRKIIFIACPNLQTLFCDDSKLSLSDDITLMEPDSKEKLEYREPLYGRHERLKSFQVFPDEPTPLLPISWMELFSHFPSLNDFAVGWGEEDESDFEEEFERLTDSIRAVRKHDPKALPFKCFEIEPAPDISRWNDPASQRRIEVMQELRLPLKSLLIKVKPDMDTATVKNALEFFSKTVREIKVTGTTSAVGLNQPFPFGIQLDNLTTLDIKEKLSGSLAFLKFTPNLEQLKISGDEAKQTKIISKRCQKEMANLRMAHLVKLRLDCIVTDQGLSCLFEWMPILTSLRMNLNDKQFGMVCGNWKKLTSLKVIGRPLTEAALTGIEHLGVETKSRWERGDSMKEATRPNITHLQNLEKFTFQSDKLTDDSVFHGFLKLPRLHRLECHTNNLCWGKGAMEALKKRKVSFEKKKFHDQRIV